MNICWGVWGTIIFGFLIFRLDVISLIRPTRKTRFDHWLLKNYVQVVVIVERISYQRQISAVETDKCLT